MMKHPLLRFLLLAVLFAAPPLLHAQRELLSPDEIDLVEKKWPGMKKTSTGMRYLVLTEGHGPSPRPGDRVAVTYTGWLLADGKKFDEQIDPENAFKFRVKRGDVIVGWDQIIQMMKVGEKRVVVIPGSLAYGARGRPPDIPRDATLVFEMQLVQVTPP
jgi:FKBP-type peptidyl-prolyl cis-trans isomerase